MNLANGFTIPDGEITENNGVDFTESRKALYSLFAEIAVEYVNKVYETLCFLKKSNIGTVQMKGSPLFNNTFELIGHLGEIDYQTERPLQASVQVSHSGGQEPEILLLNIEKVAHYIYIENEKGN